MLLSKAEAGFEAPHPSAFQHGRCCLQDSTTASFEAWDCTQGGFLYFFMENKEYCGL